jgi:ankyrin repeat protein
VQTLTLQTWGGTPLVDAAISSGNVEVIKYLPQNGAELNYENCICRGFERAASNGHYETLESLLDNGAKATVKALNLACLQGDLKIIEFLIRRGFDPNEADDRGSRALIWAMLGRKPDAIKLLLDKGAEITLRRSDGQTVLHGATSLRGTTNQKPQLEAIRLFLNYGPDIHSLDTRGKTPLHCAASLKYLSIPFTLRGRNSSLWPEGLM